MRNNKRFFHPYPVLIILICSIIVLLPIGCQAPDGETTTVASQTTEPPTTTASSSASPTTTLPTTTAVATTAETTTAATSQPIPANPLTGEPLANPQAVGKRPLAIMINNIKIATPQIGISQADLLYEMPVESGITRMMAVFADVAAVPEIGSIRSCRHNYIDLAGGLDAIYVHFGASDLGYAQLEKQNTDHIDLLTHSSFYWRDEAWIQQRGLEHSAKTNADRMQQAIASGHFRTTIRDGQKPAFQFRAAGDFVAAAGNAANQVNAQFSTYITATFTYDPAAQLYSKGQFGADQLDVATGQPIKFTNVFLLPTSVTQITNSVLKNIQLTSGNGYYISGGQWQEITWKKGSTYDSFVFINSDGQELLVNTGKSYIGILPKDSKITIK